MSIGLTLSGGGFRATLFHLGVIQYLRRAGLLTQVKHITSVSGGSIIAAHLGVNWDRYSGTEAQFNEAAKKLIEFTQLGVREHIITWLPIIAISKCCPRKLRQSQTTLLRSLYSRYLFSNRTIADLATHQGAPEIHLAATNLTRPNNLMSFSANGIRMHGQEGRLIDSKVVDLSLAVCASSAFPLLFPPVEITSALLGVTAGLLTPSPQYLSDGGIYDNYGLRALYDIQKEKPQFDLLIVSDAGARAGWQPDASFKNISLLRRASDISGQRVSDLEVEAIEKSGLAKKFAVVSIHYTTADGTQNIRDDLQRQLGTVRTDLDSFSPMLVYCLCAHGYGLARNELQKIGHSIPGGDLGTWNAISPTVPLSQDPARDMRALQDESYSHWKLFSVREWRPLLAYFVLAALLAWALYAFVPKWISQTIRNGEHWIEEFARTTWPSDDVPANVDFGDHAFLGALQPTDDEKTKDEFRLNRWLRWANDGIRPSSKRQQVIVVKSNTFDNFYRSLDVSILSRSDVKLAEGVAFLVSNAGVTGSYWPVYRQMQMRFEPSGENPPEVKLQSPDKNEFLLIVLRAVSKSDSPEAQLPESPNAFNISLRVQ